MILIDKVKTKKNIFMKQNEWRQQPKISGKEIH